MKNGKHNPNPRPLAWRVYQARDNLLHPPPLRVHPRELVPATCASADRGRALRHGENDHVRAMQEGGAAMKAQTKTMPSEILLDHWNGKKIGVMVYAVKDTYTWFGRIDSMCIKEFRALITFGSANHTQCTNDTRFFADIEDAITVLRENIKAQVEGKR